jgi:ATP-dependent DNA helicase RecQ
MEAYARSARCRWQVLHHYFRADAKGEIERCGTCDNCRKRRTWPNRPELPVEPESERGPGTAETEAEIRLGDRVSLPRYGAGKVQQIDGGAVVLRFADGRSRKFEREFVRPLSQNK